MKKQVTVYVCDLCGEECQSDYNSLPKGWIRVVTIPDKEKHLCARCNGRIMEVNDNKD